LHPALVEFLDPRQSLGQKSRVVINVRLTSRLATRGRYLPLRRHSEYM
jgi:hypothetical protein